MLRRMDAAKIPWSQSWGKKRDYGWEGFVKKAGFKPGLKEWGE